MADGHRDYSHRSRLEKLGAKEGMKVALIGRFDDDFVDELGAAVGSLRTSATGCDLVFLAVASSMALGPRQRARLLDKLGPVVRVVASDERSQARNRENALDRLRDRLAGALAVQRARRPTAPSAGAERRRLEAKRHQSEK